MKKSSRPATIDFGESADPRIERSQRVIRQAALEELGEVGYGAFTIESVAARAGVGKATIYRHWPTKVALIVNAFETLNVQTGADIVEIAPREAVKRIVRHVAEIVVDSTFSKCIPALIDAAERDAEVRAFHHGFARGRRQTLVRAIKAGLAAGEISDDVDPELAAIALVGPIFYRRLMTDSPFDPDQVTALCDAILGPKPSKDSKRRITRTR